MIQNKKTLVVGASPKEERYSNRAVKLLSKNSYDVYAFGLREGKIDTIDIFTEWPKTNDIHTVSLYVGPQNQDTYYHLILNLKPQRVIFNPGTENEVFSQMLNSEGIEVVEHCTLVMLNQGIF